LEGQGESGRYGGETGDLYVVFDVTPDPTYERDGYDLHRTLEVPWPLLVLGGTLPVETFYGTEQLRIQPGTPADHVVRVPNAGVPRLRGAGRGDLYLHLRVGIPKKLRPDQETLVRELLASFQEERPATEEEGFLAKMFGSEKNKKSKKRR